MNLSFHLISLHSPAVRRDPEAVKALLSQEFREFGSSGQIWSREEIVSLLASEEPGSFSSSDFRVQTLAAEIALVTYQAFNMASHRRSLRSSVWRCDEGAWRMVFHQGTPVP